MANTNEMLLQYKSNLIAKEIAHNSEYDQEMPQSKTADQ